MDWSPEVIDALRSHCDAMGFKFNPEVLSQFAGADFVQSFGLSPEEIAKILIEKITATELEHLLLKAVRESVDHTLISMPLADLRFAYGYLALLDAGTPVSPDQIKRALQLIHNLAQMLQGTDTD